MTPNAGGYDDGYSLVPCFWGKSPASLVAQYLKDNSPAGLKVLDIGAGEGKNANAFAEAGAQVDAIECSSYAIENGIRTFGDNKINWIEADASKFPIEASIYDIVVSYGLIHCLQSERSAFDLLKKTQQALKVGGDYIMASFNSGSHDLSAHPGFKPLLLDHNWFVEMFENWRIIHLTDSLLYETHPHNEISHHHSITRAWARKT